VPRVAKKDADVLPAGTVTVVGTVSPVLLLETATVLPPVGATWLRVTVHVDAAPELTLVGLQARAETSVGANRFRVVVCTVPFKVAVIMAL